jgi:MtrB/PioB family decaheme-associated outer membrane protein
MTRAAWFAVAWCAAASVAVAQQPAGSPDDFETGEISIGVGQTDSDTLSSKFEEYRDLPNGLVVPAFRFRGQKDGFQWDFAGRDVREKDQQFRLDLSKGAFSLEGDYNQIPHNFGNDGHTLLQNTREGVWEISDSTQRAFQTTLEGTTPRSLVNFNFLSALVAPGLAASNSVDLGLQRERGRLELKVTPDGPFAVKVAYFRERRVGDRAASGTAFGFGNVIELPEPLHYLTQDFGADASYSGDWGVVMGGLHYNWFENRVETLAFDNPFRVTDSTDASAYQAPGSASVNGPARGLMALPPDNEAWTGTLGGTLLFPRRTRVSAHVTKARFTQDSPFIPYSTNSAIVTPVRATDVAALPARSLDGKIDVTSFSVNATTRPVGNLTLVGRVRQYDLDNQTAQITFPVGYARFDAAWNPAGRISVPYGYKTLGLDGIASYGLGRVTLEAGFKHRGIERTFRETEETSENGVTLAVDARAAGWLVLRGTFERGSRDYEHLEIELSEHSSFLAAGAPTNLLAIPPPDENPAFAALYASLCGPGGPVCNLRFDQARKDISRYGATAQLTPTGETGLRVSWLRTDDDYDETRYGLTRARYDTISADADYTPNDRFTAYAFFTHEKLRDAQRGKQSGATVSANPLDDWTSDVEDEVDTFGAGATVALVKDTWFLDLSGHHQKADGNNDLFSAPGGAPAAGRTGVGGIVDIPLYDDTKMTRLSGELRYAFAKAWSAAIGGFLEDYEVADSNADGLLNYVPGSFFLAANDADYRAKVGYLRFTYRW